MSKKDKLISRLKSKPKDMTFAELEALLLSLGFKKDNKGRSSDSRVEFVYGDVLVKIHRPHKYMYFHEYQIKDVINVLTAGGLI